MIELQEIRKSYPVGPTEVEVLKGVDLTVGEGELVSIMGTSGSGKSTLMNIMGLLDTATSGRYLLDDEDVSRCGDDELSTIRNRKIGFVFQSFHLLPRMSAIENVGLPLVYRGVGEREARERAVEMLYRVGMGERLEHRPFELSGGQQQRLAIARALVGNPTLILADEPTGALDSEVGGEIMELFERLNGDDGITIVIITHDSGVAGRCRRRLVMRDGLLREEVIR